MGTGGDGGSTYDVEKMEEDREWLVERKGGSLVNAI